MGAGVATLLNGFDVVGPSAYTPPYRGVYTVAFHVRDRATDAAVRKLASLKGKSLTETIREAVEREYAAISGTSSLIDRLQPIQVRFQALKRPGGCPADKAFFDDLSGQS